MVILLLGAILAPESFAKLSDGVMALVGALAIKSTLEHQANAKNIRQSLAPLGDSDARDRSSTAP
jgi:hypothetical protein